MGLYHKCIVVMLVDVYRPLSGVCGFRSLPFFRVEVPVYYRSVLVVLDMCVHPTFFCSGGFRCGRAGSGPPLGDGLTPSLTVMLANAKF